MDGGLENFGIAFLERNVCVARREFYSLSSVGPPGYNVRLRRAVVLPRQGAERFRSPLARPVQAPPTGVSSDRRREAAGGVRGVTGLSLPPMKHTHTHTLIFSQPQCTTASIPPTSQHTAAAIASAQPVGALPNREHTLRARRIQTKNTQNPGTR